MNEMNEKVLSDLEKLGKVTTEKMKLKQEVKNFLHRQGTYTPLRTLVNIFAPTKSKDIKFVLNVGGGSYTDGKVVVAGLFDIFWTKKKEEIYSSLKAITAHEVGHVIYSDFDLFVKFQEDVMEYLDKKHGVDKEVSRKIAQMLLNSLEDGRIERLMGQRFLGIIEDIRYMRSCFWEEMNVVKPNDSQFTAWSTAILSLGTTGLWPKGFDIEIHEEAYDEVVKVLPWIQEAVLANTAEECVNACWQILYASEEFILKAIEETNQLMDLLEELMQNQTNQFENERDSSGDGKLPQNQQEATKGGTHLNGNLLSSKRLRKMAEEMKKNTQENSNQQGEGSSNEIDENSQENSNDENSQGNSNDENSQGNSNDENGQSNQNLSQSNSREGDSPNSSSQENDFSKRIKTDQKMTREMVVEEEINPATPETYHRLIEDLKKRHEEKTKEEIKRIETNEANQEKIKQAREAREALQRAKLETEISEVKKLFRNDFTYHEVPFEAERINVPNEILAKGRLLHNHFKTVLNQDPEEDFARYKRGSLDTKSLWRVSTNEKRLFNRREPDVYSCAVSILIDGSGSMSSYTKYYGEKSTRFEDALRAGAIIEEALRGLVPLDITVFTTGYSEVLHFPLKQYDVESPINHCWSFFKNSTGPFAGNCDGYSIAIAGNKLKKRSEDQKILFVISDGLPAFTNGVEETRKAVQDLKKNGVKVIGIGVGEEAIDSQDQFLRMYEKQSVLIETEKITNYLIRYLSKLLA